MPPHMLIDPDRGHPLEPVRVIDQPTLSFSEDRGVRRMPGHPETCCDPGHGEVIDHDAFQCPPESAPGNLRSPFSRLRRVLPPRTATPGAAVAAHPYQQRRGSVPERFMRQPAPHGVSWRSFRTAGSAPRIRLDNTALDHRPIKPKVLSDSFQAELVEPAEHGEVRRSEGSVEHVEVFRMASVGTSIIGRPRPLSRHRRAHPAHACYTVNYEEPVSDPVDPQGFVG